MIKNDIQITLNINGDDIYIMKYPETVDLTLQLARSEEWWGVFLSVIETFQAIKEDRDYLLNAFNKWETNGYSDDFYINIDIAVLEYETYISIYNGVAMPDYEDDTYYFKTKFEETGNIRKFLDGAIDHNLDFENDATSYRFRTGMQTLFDVINQYKSSDIIINELGININDDLRELIWPTAGSDSLSTQKFTSGEDQIKFNYIGNKKIAETKKYFFEDDFIVIPKQTAINIELSGGGTFSIVPFGKNESDNYIGASSFQVDAVLNNSYSIEDTFNFNFVDSGFLPPRFILDNSTVYVENFTNNNETIILRTDSTNLFNTDNQGVTYFVVLGNYDQRLKIDYYTNNDTIDNITISNIIGRYLDYDFSNNYIDESFGKYAFFPFDGAIGGTSTHIQSINISEFLGEIKKALSVGVSVDQGSKNLVIRYIPEMFSNLESIYISEENVFSITISLNEFLKIGRLVCGAGDRKFNYYNTENGQNRTTVYNARNSFSNELNLELNAYKAQSYDFIDSYKDDIFELYEEDKNDGEIVLFHKDGVNAVNNSRFTPINAAHTATSQICAWSWLLQVVSPNGFDSESESNNVVVNSPITGDEVELTKDIEPSNPIFTQSNPVITLRKFNVNCKLTTKQYNLIVNNRDRYITVNYRGVDYKGYINNLSLKVGKNMIADIELLEKYEL